MKNIALLLALFWACLAVSLKADDKPLITLSDTVHFAASDDARFSEPDFDIQPWQTLTWQQVPPTDFRGISWLRTTLTVAPEMQGQMVAFYHWRVIGAATFYLNGEEIFSIGQPAAEASNEVAVLQEQPLLAVLPSPWRVEPNGDLTYVLAIRHSNHFLKEAPWDGMIRPGVRFSVAQQAPVIEHYREELSWNLLHQWVLIGICISFVVLHMLMFVFYPQEKSNLAFALMTLSWSVLIYCGFHSPADFEEYLWFERLVKLAMASMAFFTVFMGHALSLKNQPVMIYGFLLLSLAYVVWGYFYPFSELLGLWLVTLMIVEMIRVMWPEERGRGMREGWVIGVGSIPISIMTLYSFLVNVVGFNWPSLDLIYYYYCIVVYLLSMSFFLALRIANFQKSLEAQIVQIKELSEENLKQELERVKLQTENARKSEELEAARQFQLSMLPRQMPQHPDVALAATMSTATEVGGDYYDVFVAKDGCLTCVVGDATGHGIQAGTFVAGTKTLFNALAEEPEPRAFLQKISRALKMMGLRKMFMALTFARYQHGELTLAAAGMPLALHFVAATGKVEEVMLKAPPLASLPTFPYQSLKLPMATGDAVLLFSDGLLERFNPQDEMYGEARMAALFEEVGHEAPEQIMERLVAAGEAWAQGRPQDDDITLLVIKRLPENVYT